MIGLDVMIAPVVIVALISKVSTGVVIVIVLDDASDLMRSDPDIGFCIYPDDDT
jgi:hypothetical protein